MRPQTVAASLLSALLAFAPLASSAADAPSALQQASGAESLWLPPLGEPLRIDAHFSLPNGPYRAGHRGIDLLGEAGRVVRSPADGTVSFVGTVVDRPVLSLRVDERTVLSLEPIESELETGEAVARGQPLGTIAAGGHCAPDCLHLGVRVDGEYVNPLRFLRPLPVLLPW